MINNNKVSKIPHSFDIPILFLIFNRLDTTKQVFAAIRKAFPRKLYIASDGPRDNREGENEKIETVREYVLNSIDWDCEVKTLFREKNLGCKKAVSEAITWFFENEKMGIILEDDCLPNHDFFHFCKDLLVLYQNDTRIFLISGHNKQGLWKHDTCDYFFSNMGSIWGWATWARAWKHYDFEMLDIKDFIVNNNFVNLLGEGIGQLRQNTIYTEMILKKVDSWAYPWGYTLNKNNALACVPSKNLVVNIGFGEEATHTHNIIKQPDTYKLSFPLKINNYFVPDREFHKKYLGYDKRQKKIGKQLRKKIMKKLKWLKRSLLFLIQNIFLFKIK